MKKMLSCLIVSVPLLTSNLSYSMGDEKDGTITIRTTDETQIQIARILVPRRNDNRGMITITADADTFNTAVMPGLELGLAQRRYTQTLEGLPSELLAKAFETGCLLQSKEVKKNVFDVLKLRMKQNHADFIRLREADGCESECQQESPRKNVSDMSDVDIAELLRKRQEFLDQREEDRKRVSLATIDLNIEEFVEEGLESLAVPRLYWSEFFEELESALNDVKQKLIFADMFGTVQKKEELERQQEEIEAANKSEQKLREMIGLRKGAELINGMAITD